VHEGPLVVFSGGGTGGHLYPALAVADALRELRPDVRALFVGAERGLEARVLPERGEEHVLLPVQGVDRAHKLSSWRALTGLATSLARIGRLFAERRPEAVVVTGGYAGAPAGIMAGLTGVPLILQEQNSVPGVVTRLLTRWASRVHVAFPEVVGHLPVAHGLARVTGNPVRSASSGGREVARATLRVPSNARLVLVAGGSQGSLALNRVMSEAVRGVVGGELTRPEGLQLLWSTGPKHIDTVSSLLTEYESPEWVQAVPYIDDMPTALAAADLAVSRAGAMSTAELLNQGLPAILVPFPYAAADHQTHNARSLERAGVAVVKPESELTGASLWSEIESLLSEPELLARMGDAAVSLGRPRAAFEIAADIASFLETPGGLR
jgi:UDP-N-acetylglucosamine--N-acetylmuramyl-(pentapeptide) pyrophosphoryl-undecaprenol N-acetylglucosamine transferase